MGFARSFIVRKNPIKMILIGIINVLKEIFSIKQKQKVVRYRLNYQIHKLQEMENMIARNNEHTFLRGNKFNEMR